MHQQGSAIPPWPVKRSMVGTLEGFRKISFRHGVLAQFTGRKILLQETRGETSERSYSQRLGFLSPWL